MFPASGERHGLLYACIEELKDCLGDNGSAPEFLDHDTERGYRLLVAKESSRRGNETDEIGDWFDELKRRRVFRAVAAYGVAAWLLLQIIDVLSGAWPVPDWTLTAATVALAIGFPVSALLAWIFQITPAGLITESGIGGLKLDRTRLVHYFDLVVIGVLLIIVAFLSYGHVFSSLERGEEVRIAVLPFENLSAEEGDAYLSEGIADDIRSRLYDLPQVLVAARSSSKSLSLDNRLVEVHTALGGLYTISGDLGAAEKSFNAAIEIDPRAVDARAGLGDVYDKQDRLAEAEAQYILAIELLPANWLGYSKFGRFLLRRQRYAEAVVNYERAIELAPANANGYNNLGVIYYFLGDFQKAADSYRRSLKIDPDGAPYSNIGTINYYAGNFFAAEQMFLLAADETPTDYRMWGNLADAQRFTGPDNPSAWASYERAVDLANLQLEVNPSDSDTLVNLAWYYANLQRDVAARNALEAADPKSIADAAQLYMVALVYSLLGESTAALQYQGKATLSGFPQALIDATPEFKSQSTATEIGARGQDYGEQESHIDDRRELRG